MRHQTDTTHPWRHVVARGQPARDIEGGNRQRYEHTEGQGECHLRAACKGPALAAVSGEWNVCVSVQRR